jgi:hypothetical protein
LAPGALAAVQLPSMHGSREDVEVGGLMSYAPSVRDLFRRATRSHIAGLVDQLVGAGEQRRWHLDAKDLGGRQIDDEIELGRLPVRP